MKKRVLLTALLCAVMAGCWLAAPVDAAEADFRAVWVSSVVNLDYPSSPTTDPAKLKAEVDGILDNCVSWGLNAVILQVRPSSDSLYPSAIYPWSKYLTGAQGRAPVNNFDPLAYWLEAAHARGLELHAWINPYRAAMSETDFNSLADSHPAKTHPDWVKLYDGKYYFDPGIPAVRQMVADGVREIVDNYGVDGIHLDDYFYPAAAFPDDDTFAAYNSGGFTNKLDWRRNNNDLLIQELHRIVKQSGKTFGVSPAGIWANQSSHPLGSATAGSQTYSVACADTYKWVKEGWLDYICPQIYWYIGYTIADYEVLAYWWADVVRGTGVKLYIGMADYRTGGEGGWAGIQAMVDSAALNRKIPEITGEVHFRYGSLRGSGALQEFYRSLYAARYDGPAPQLDTVNHTAYMVGDNGLFRPENPLTRAEAATLFSRLAVDKNGSVLYDDEVLYYANFSDITADQWFRNTVNFMYHYRLIEGYPGNVFQPLRNMTRAEYIMLVSRFLTVDESAPDAFSDTKGHWARQVINSAAAQGLIEGYGDGAFLPDRAISRAEAARLTNHILGRIPDRETIDTLTATNPFSDLKKGYWAYYDIIEASYSHDYTQDGGVEHWTGGA